MSEKLISVVIPTYHRNDLLARCLERLAPGAQALDTSQYDVLVTDDGKTSTAEAMIREKFPWARWVKGPQRGPAANRNNGASHVDSPWIVFTDDDCIPSAGWLAAYVAAIEDTTDIYEGKTTCEAGCRPWVEEAPINLAGGVLWSCNMVVRRSRYQQMHGFDEQYPLPMMEDVDFNERAVRAGLKVKWTPAAVIDHPPRLRRKGIALGKLWENRVLFIFKHKVRPACTVWLPVHVAKCRTRQILDIGLRRESFIAAGNCGLEIGYVITHVYGWQRKYKRLYNPESEHS